MLTNFIPTKGKKSFNFLKTQVWQSNNEFPFSHYHHIICGDGSGLFHSIVEPNCQIGEEFTFQGQKFIIESLEQTNFGFDKTTQQFTIYFRKK